MAQTTGQRVGRTGLGAAGIAVTVATMLTNGLAYLVPMLGARQLDPADLSSLATLLALGAIAGVPGAGLQLAVAVHRARHGSGGSTRLSWATALTTGGLVVLAAPLITTMLRLPLELVGLLAAMTVAVVLAGRWLGELQGGQRFVRLAAAMAVFAVGRYGGLIAGLWAGAGLTGSLLLGAVSAGLTLPVLARLARPAPATTGARDTTTGVLHTADARSTANAQDTTGAPGTADAPTAGTGILDPPAAVRAALTARHVMTASSASLAMLTVSYADLILARQVLPVTASAGYAVGTVLTKGALWAPQVVTVIALPRLAAGHRGTRLAALGLVAVCGVVLVTAAALAGELAFRLAGGAGYAGLARYAPFFAATGALYALVFVLVNDQVARSARRPSAPLWAAVAVLAGSILFVAPATIDGVLGCAVAVAAATAATMLWLSRGGTPARPSPGPGAPAPPSPGAGGTTPEPPGSAAH